MTKKGFTLVELLAVVVLITLITIIGSVGITGVKNSINKNMLESKIYLIESEAARYGEDHKNRFLKLPDTDEFVCEIDGVKHSKCLKNVKVQELIDRGYIQTKETIILPDGNEKKVMINNTKDEEDEGYYLNDLFVYIYLEDNNFYAKLMIEE